MPVYFRDDQAVLFIHIPKCGGTSVETQMRRFATHSLLFNVGGDMLPCSPQHFHREVLDVVLESPSIPSFALVRHPTLRAISAYLYWTRKCAAHAPDIETFFQSEFAEYHLSPYRSDNHIRPQYQYLLPDTRVFRLEDGLLNAVRFGLEHLGVADQCREEIPVKERSRAHQGLMLPQTLRRIETFYADDFELLGYQPIAHEFASPATLSEIKARLSDVGRASNLDWMKVEQAWLKFRIATNDAERRAAAKTWSASPLGQKARTTLRRVRRAIKATLRSLK